MNNLPSTEKDKRIDVYTSLYGIWIPITFFTSYLVLRNYALDNMIWWVFFLTCLVPSLVVALTYFRIKSKGTDILDTALGNFIFPKQTYCPHPILIKFSDFWLRFLMTSSVSMLTVFLVSEFVDINIHIKMNIFNLIALVSFVLSFLLTGIRTSIIKKAMLLSENTISRNLHLKASFYKFLMLISAMTFSGLIFPIAMYFDKSVVVLVLLFTLPVFISFIAIRIWQMQEIHLKYLKESEND